MRFAHWSKILHTVVRLQLKFLIRPTDNIWRIWADDIRCSYERDIRYTSVHWCCTDTLRTTTSWIVFDRSMAHWFAQCRRVFSELKQNSGGSGASIKHGLASIFSANPNSVTATSANLNSQDLQEQPPDCGEELKNNGVHTQRSIASINEAGADQSDNRY